MATFVIRSPPHYRPAGRQPICSPPGPVRQTRNRPGAEVGCGKKTKKFRDFDGTFSRFRVFLRGMHTAELPSPVFWSLLVATLAHTLGVGQASAGAPPNTDPQYAAAIAAARAGQVAQALPLI